MAEELKPGTTLMWFRLESVLGRGGFGITYLATDVNLQTKVAIKEYLPGDISTRILDSRVVPRADDDIELYKWGLTRFLEEARILAQFKHPHIVRVLTVFEENNTAYMVMEYEQGNDLSCLVKTPHYKTEAFLKNLLSQILSGLAEVHQRHIIHRDIKPANIFIREDGSAVLLDFGSARQSVSGQSKVLTRILTVGYAPYEQIDEHGGEQGPWTDIYSIGATLYYIIAGVLPTDSFSRFTHIIRQKPDPLKPVSELVDQTLYSRDFLHAIDCAMAFDAKDRPADVHEFMSLLLGESHSSEDITVLATRLINTQASPSLLDTLVSPTFSEEGSAQITRNLMGDQSGSSITHAHREVTLEPADNDEETVQKVDRSSRVLFFAGPIFLLVFGGIGWYWLNSGQVDTQLIHQMEESNRQHLPAAQKNVNTLLNQLAEQEAEEAEEARQRQLAEQEAEEARQRQLADQEAEEAHQRQLAEQKAEEARQRQLAEQEAEEARQRQLAEQEAEEARQRQLAEQKAEEARQRQLAEQKAEEARQRQLAEQKAEEARQRQLAEQKAEKERKSEERLALLDQQAGKSGIELLNKEISGLVAALETMDVDRIRKISNMGSKTETILEGISSRYSRCDISISNVSVSESRGRAVAKLVINRVFRENGEQVIPGKAWSTFDISMNKSEGVWGALSW